VQVRRYLSVLSEKMATFSVPTNPSGPRQIPHGPGLTRSPSTTPFIRAAPRPTANPPDRWPWIIVTRQPRMTPKLSQCVCYLIDLPPPWKYKHTTVIVCVCVGGGGGGGGEYFKRERGNCKKGRPGMSVCSQKVVLCACDKELRLDDERRAR